MPPAARAVLVGSASCDNAEGPPVADIESGEPRACSAPPRLETETDTEVLWATNPRLQAEWTAHPIEEEEATEPQAAAAAEWTVPQSRLEWTANPLQGDPTTPAKDGTGSKDDVGSNVAVAKHDVLPPPRLAPAPKRWTQEPRFWWALMLGAGLFTVCETVLSVRLQYGESQAWGALSNLVARAPFPFVAVYPWLVAFPAFDTPRARKALCAAPVASVLLASFGSLGAPSPNPLRPSWPFQIANVLWSVFDGVLLTAPAWLTRREWSHRCSKPVIATALATNCVITVGRIAKVMGCDLVILTVLSALLSFVMLVLILGYDTYRAWASAPPGPSGALVAPKRPPRRRPTLALSRLPFRDDGGYILAVILLCQGMPFMATGFLVKVQEASRASVELVTVLAWQAGNVVRPSSAARARRSRPQQRRSFVRSRLSHTANAPSRPQVFFGAVVLAAQRALSPARAPVLLFAMMLTQDILVDLVFVDLSLEDPVFWGALLLQISVQLVRESEVFSKHTAQSNGGDHRLRLLRRGGGDAARGPAPAPARDRRASQKVAIGLAALVVDVGANAPDNLYNAESSEEFKAAPRERVLAAAAVHALFGRGGSTRVRARLLERLADARARLNARAQRDAARDVSRLSALSQCFASSGLLLALGCEHALARWRVGEATFTRGTDAAGRVTTIYGFALAFVLQMIATCLSYCFRERARRRRARRSMDRPRRAMPGRQQQKQPPGAASSSSASVSAPLFADEKDRAHDRAFWSTHGAYLMCVTIYTWGVCIERAADVKYREAVREMEAS